MRRGIGTGLALVLALAAVVAGTTLPSRAASTGVDYVLLVDDTGTMKHGERGAMTLVALTRFVDMMETGDRISVFSYGQAARPVLSSYPVEIQDDASKAGVRKQLAFAFKADRTDITAGVDIVWRERDRVFPRHKSGTGEAVVVLLTDGKLIPAYDDYSQYEQIYQASRAKLRDLAHAFGKEGIPIHTVGVGSAAKVDPKHLKSIAEWSGGATYHVTDAGRLADVYAEIYLGSRPEVVVSPVVEQEPVALAQSDSRGTWEDAQPRGATEKAVTSDSAPLSTFDLFYRGTTGVIAVFLGLVVIGARRRQPWAEFFTRTIGPLEQRVRGYLKPVDPDGVQSARAIVGIENPGLPTLEIGMGTRYADFARETLIDFIGTRDGTPPTINILKGEVTVDGQLVTEPQKLKDGDIVAIEGSRYMYLRGSRR